MIRIVIVFGVLESNPLVFFHGFKDDLKIVLVVTRRDVLQQDAILQRLSTVKKIHQWDGVEQPFVQRVVEDEFFARIRKAEFTSGVDDLNVIILESIYPTIDGAPIHLEMTGQFIHVERLLDQFREELMIVA